MYLESKMTMSAVIVALLMILNWGSVDAAAPTIPFISSVPSTTTITTVVDEGQSVTFRCSPSSDTGPIVVWAFKKDAADARAAEAAATYEITEVASATHAGVYTCLAGDAADAMSPASFEGITLTVTALAAPTLTTHPTQSASTVKQTEGQIITFVCTHATGNKAPREYKFFMGSAADSMTEITTGHSNGVYALTVKRADHDKKVIKCQHYNANTATGKKDSAVLTLSVSAASTCKPSSGNAPTISLCLLVAMAMAPLFSSSRD